MWQSYSLVFFTKNDARVNFVVSDSLRILTTFQNGDHETYEKILKDISQIESMCALVYNCFFFNDHPEKLPWAAF